LVAKELTKLRPNDVGNRAVLSLRDGVNALDRLIAANGLFEDPPEET
jgi:hypothetical protein